MSIIDKIRQRQVLAVLPHRRKPPRHQPEMLYIGCVDARLDPIDDIGITKGKALIFRNIAAVVPKDSLMGASLSRAVITPDGEIPHNISIGAVLELFLTILPLQSGTMKHIVVSGHTDCGGMRACQEGVGKHHHPHLFSYLEGLQEIRARVNREADAKGWSALQTRHALEKESVRQSMRNLLTYPVVRQAMKEGRVELHGWVINTASQRISEMNPQTLEFEPMATKRALRRLGSGAVTKDERIGV